MDSLTGAHTQSIERTWLYAKTKIMKTMRGTTKKLLQSQLDHYHLRIVPATYSSYKNYYFSLSNLAAKYVFFYMHEKKKVEIR
jgi:hypothetical protein